jgi:hypothetical protein
MLHEMSHDEAVWPVHARTLTLSEPEDAGEETGSWWRDLAAGSALAALVVSVAVMFLK